MVSIGPRFSKSRKTRADDSQKQLPQEGAAPIFQHSSETAKIYPHISVLPCLFYLSEQVSTGDVGGTAISSCSLLCPHTETAWIPDPPHATKCGCWLVTNTLRVCVLAQFFPNLYFPTDNLLIHFKIEKPSSLPLLDCRHTEAEIQNKIKYS